jgi:ABC-type Mn2+/Zn2+ transport system permease subunit
MLELFSFQFMQRALLGGAVVGLVCSTVGVFVVLRGLSFIGAGISHAAFAGVALGIVLGISPLLTALVFCSTLACCVGYVSRLGKIQEDTSIGIFFAASMAFGIALMSWASVNSNEILGYLFGSILTIPNQDLFVSMVLSLFVVLLVVIFDKELIAVSFDEELAGISGIPAKFISYLLLVMVSITIVASIRVVGIVLVSALIVIPAATALQISQNIKKIMLISAIIGVASTELGLIFSYYLGCAPGATIVLLSTAMFVCATAVRATKAS